MSVERNKKLIVDKIKEYSNELTFGYFMDKALIEPCARAILTLLETEKPAVTKECQEQKLINDRTEQCRDKFGEII
jgi:hypothetical protein